jgi:hypothetical protein
MILQIRRAPQLVQEALLRASFFDAALLRASFFDAALLRASFS